MRILLVTPFLPDPAAAHGGGVLLGALAEGLARHADLGLAAIAGAEERAALAAEPGRWAWHATAAAPERPAGLAKVGHQFRNLWAWRSKPLVAAKIAGVGFERVLQRARQEFRPDVALVELAQMAQFLPALEGLPTFLTDHEAGCPANTHTGLGALGDRRDRRLWWRLVRRDYPLADRIQALTREDAAVLADVLDRPVTVRTPLFDVPEQAVEPERAPPRALFLGDYLHGPNPEAAEVLAREVLPRLRAEIPEAELWLAGRNQHRIAGLEGLPGVRLVGFVPELRDLLGQVRLLLAPVFSGAGLRIKCIVAHAHGLPVVTNALGARGFDVPEPARVVAEGAEGLSAASLPLLRDSSLAAKAGRAAHAWSRSHVHVDAVAKSQVESARELVEARRATS